MTKQVVADIVSVETFGLTGIALTAGEVDTRIDACEPEKAIQGLDRATTEISDPLMQETSVTELYSKFGLEWAEPNGLTKPPSANSYRIKDEQLTTESIYD